MAEVLLGLFPEVAEGLPKDVLELVGRLKP